MSLKKPKVKNLRNVLASPFNIHWSKNNSEAEELLQKTLEKLLPLAKLENTGLKLKPKIRTKEKSRVGPIPVKKHSNIFRTYLVPGFQSVIRGLEKNELCCVILSIDISPPMIQRIICGYCNTYNTPLFVIPQLKTITKSALGFSTMVLGLKKIAESPENNFYPIYELVSQNPCVFETPFTVRKKGGTVAGKGDECILRTEVVSSLKTEDIYLYRERRSDRVFRPGIGTINKVVSQCQLSSPVNGVDENFVRFTKSEFTSSKTEHLNINVMKNASQSGSEDYGSDADSLDEDNIFFVDNKPDPMLLEAEPSNSEEKFSQTIPDFERSGVKSFSNEIIENAQKKKVTSMNERYFSSNIKQDGTAPKFRKKGKKVTKQKPAGLTNKDSTERSRKFISSQFNPLKIKTVISNPKKRKKK